MDAFQMDSQLWAEKQFGQARLGNKTRTRRLVRLARQIAANPSGSLPEQTGQWKDLKAAYRLFDRKEVTFEAVATPHWEQTRMQCVSGRYLLIDDTSELDFGIRREIDGMGPTGNGGGYGFLLHSALAVAADSEAVVGLMGQRVHYRQHAPKKENASQRLKRKRESEIWGQVIDQVGPPPAGAQWVHVCDRGADNFEVFCHARVQGTSWVIRVTQLQRKIWDPSGKEMPLQQYLATLPAKGMQELRLRTRSAQPGRTAQLTISFGALTMPVPRQKSSYLQALKPGPIAMWVVWAREVNAPKHGEAIEWVLYSALPGQQFGRCADGPGVLREALVYRRLAQSFEDGLSSDAATAQDLSAAGAAGGPAECGSGATATASVGSADRAGTSRSRGRSPSLLGHATKSPRAQGC